MLVAANHYGKFYTEQVYDNIHNIGNPSPHTHEIIIPY